jgi:hypothetical protein
MNRFVRISFMTNALAAAALVAGAGSSMLATAHAQSAPARLGEANGPVILAQQSQQQSQQKPRQPAQPGPRVSEIAGRYAVLREEGKDTLCMVTLFDTARGRGYYRAQLAPACRDNGIVIFDPIAWSIDNKGHISLQARKGHKMVLERDANSVWQRAGDPKARPLGLRRI